MCCYWKVERKKQGKMKAAAISKFEEIVTAPPALKLDRTKPDADYLRLQSIVDTARIYILHYLFQMMYEDRN